MNYRIDMAYLDVKALLNVPPDLPSRPTDSDDDRKSVSPTRLHPSQMSSPVKMNKVSLGTLLKNDQLKDQRDRGLVFPGFNESPIKFQPSYKFDIGTVCL
jgi:hypothetical protein